jgi:hypothetical protein
LSAIFAAGGTAADIAAAIFHAAGLEATVGPAAEPLKAMVADQLDRIRRLGAPAAIRMTAGMGEPE